MNDQEAKRILKDMMDRGLGVSGHHVSNGADYYHCSMCFASKDTMGFAAGGGVTRSAEEWASIAYEMADAMLAGKKKRFRRDRE